MGREGKAVPDLRDITGPVPLDDAPDGWKADDEEVFAIADVNSHALQRVYFGTPIEIQCAGRSGASACERKGCLRCGAVANPFSSAL